MESSNTSLHIKEIMSFCAQPETNLLKENFLDVQLDTSDLKCNPQVSCAMCHPDSVAYITTQKEHRYNLSSPRPVFWFLFSDLTLGLASRVLHWAYNNSEKNGLEQLINKLLSLVPFSGSTHNSRERMHTIDLISLFTALPSVLAADLQGLRERDGEVSVCLL